MEEYLFLISIGPVQSFIASARRTRDLWFGSTLLSELARAASIMVVKENPENILIFPALDFKDLEAFDRGEPINVANKILAHIHQSPQQLADKVLAAINDRLRELRDLAYKGIDDNRFQREIAEAQVNDLIEYLWVALPYKRNEYAKTRDTLEALMAARKNTRDFASVGWGSTQQKSSIDGQLESVIPADRYPRRGEDEPKRQQKVRFLYSHYKASSAEQLSGVDLLKRLGRLSEDISIASVLTSFPSTSQIAAIPFLLRLNSLTEEDKKQANMYWESYIDQLKRVADAPDALMEQTIPPHYPPHPILGRYEGSLLFEDRWVDLVSDTNSVRKGEKAAFLEKAKKALRDFFDIVKVHPSPYYAILRADGDHMGKAIDAQAKKLDGEQAHQRLSLVLSEFAGNVRNIVETQYLGALVYAGGDDVLAFMPLHTVLQCARELQNQFRDKLEPFTFKLEPSKDNNDISPTLSAGIVVIHHLSSLREALDLAKKAEDRAKDIQDKNKDALAITISKRSGDDYTVVGHWGELDSSLDTLIDFCSTDDIPDGTAYELRDLALRLATPIDHKTDSDKQESDEQSKREMRNCEKVLRNYKIQC